MCPYSGVSYFSFSQKQVHIVYLHGLAVVGIAFPTGLRRCTALHHCRNELPDNCLVYPVPSSRNLSTRKNCNNKIYVRNSRHHFPLSISYFRSRAFLYKGLNRTGEVFMLIKFVCLLFSQWNKACRLVIRYVNFMTKCEQYVGARTDSQPNYEF